MTEVALRELGQGWFNTYSAGSHPTGRVNPYALAQLQSQGYAIDGLRSKSWDEFAQADAPVMDLIMTVCDNAAGEQCPFWPGKPATAHWGFSDPSQIEGGDSEKRQAFKDVMIGLRKRLDILASMPLDKLDSMTLKDIHTKS